MCSILSSYITHAHWLQRLLSVKDYTIKICTKFFNWWFQVISPFGWICQYGFRILLEHYLIIINIIFSIGTSLSHTKSKTSRKQPFIVCAISIWYSYLCTTCNSLPFSFTSPLSSPPTAVLHHHLALVSTTFHSSPCSKCSNHSWIFFFCLPKWLDHEQN